MTKSISAFSLVELSIVLVILGLLTGGILTGQNLIRAAELRSVVTEFQRYQTAVQTFRDKYFALPGDMSNAIDFWGSAGGSGTLGDGCESATGTGTQTCNGDGDGRIDNGPPSEYTEGFTFWHQLASSGLIEGTYTGVNGADSTTHTLIGENTPSSKLSSAGLTIAWVSGYMSSENYNIGQPYNNTLIFGSQNTSYETSAPILSPEEAWNIDSKIDDGKPSYGRIVNRYINDLCSVANSGSSISSNLNARYKLSDSSIRCALNFHNVF